MPVQLPKPIECYFAADNSNDPGDLDACFAAGATVRDEGRTHAGLAAIKRWKAAAKKKYRYVIEPLEADERAGRVMVMGRVSGDFPGSPVTLQFSFTLAGDKITSLEIRA